MPKRTLGSLGSLVRQKRGDAKLRETAKKIGIGPATLMRIENGRVPDIDTFGKVCRWLGIEPNTFLGFEPSKESPEKPQGIDQAANISVSAHLRADEAPLPETVRALAQMILMATGTQKGTREDGDLGHDS
ncbi:MAG TPA: helix-turn-helix transcriptional regulator [Blastocatellia bacterium]